jgi:hypothetical protein
MSEVAAFTAWLGGALVVLADGRRGLAAGLALLAVAAAGVTWAAGDEGGAVVLLAGGVVGSVLRFTIGAEGWGLMEPGSTPRLLFAVIVGLVALWLAVAVTSGDDAGFRFAVLAALLLLGGRFFQEASQTALLTAIAGVVLILGALAREGIAACVVAALITAGISAMPVAPPAPRTRGT